MERQKKPRVELVEEDDILTRQQQRRVLNGGFKAKSVQVPSNTPRKNFYFHQNNNSMHFKTFGKHAK